MPVAPGTTLEFHITLVRADTFEPVRGVAVALQRFDPAIGDFRPIVPGTTQVQGDSVLTSAAPTQAGRYRYRAAWPGNAQFRGDTSPEIRVDVEAPA